MRTGCERILSLILPPLSLSLHVISQLEIGRVGIEVGLFGEVGLLVLPDVVVYKGHRHEFHILPKGIGYESIMFMSAVKTNILAQKTFTHAEYDTLCHGNPFIL
jgi:hypothetical protein